MKHEISYLIDQQCSHVLEVRTADKGAQPISIQEGRTPIELSYVQALAVLDALSEAVAEIEEDGRVPGPNVEYPGYVIGIRRS